MRVLALDVGERRIGLAISDPDGRVAVPLDTLERRGEDADLEALVRLVEREGVQAVVVGLPLSLDGSLGRQAALTQEFARRLAKVISPPLEMWDERLSSVAAERSLAAPGAAQGRERRRPRGDRRRPSRRRQGAQDALAAALVLQSYLDSRSRPPHSSAGGGPAPGGGQR